MPKWETMAGWDTLYAGPVVIQVTPTGYLITPMAHKSFAMIGVSVPEGREAAREQALAKAREIVQGWLDQLGPAPSGVTTHREHPGDR